MSNTSLTSVIDIPESYRHLILKDCVSTLILSTRIEAKPNGLLQEILHDGDIQHIGKKDCFAKGAQLRGRMGIPATQFPG